MKITIRQLKRLIEGIMSDDPEFPEKTDLGPTVDLLKTRKKRSDDFKAYQADLEDSFEKASQAEPKAQARMMQDFEAMLVSQSPHAEEEFVLGLTIDPKYVGQFFDFSKGTIQLRPPYQRMVSQEREQKIYDAIRIMFDESDPVYGKIIRNEKEERQFKSFANPNASFEQRVRNLFNTNELRVLDGQFRPVIQGNDVICDWNVFADQVCISFPGLSPDDMPDVPFLDTGEDYNRTPTGGRQYGGGTYYLPLIDLGGIHFFWFMANQKTEYNKMVAEYDGDIWEAYEDLRDRHRPGEFGSFIYDWFPKMAAYCCVYARSTELGIEWLGGDSWHTPGGYSNPISGDEDSPMEPYVIQIRRNRGPLLIIADMINARVGNISFSDFPDFNHGNDRLEIFP